MPLSETITEILTLGPSPTDCKRGGFEILWYLSLPTLTKGENTHFYFPTSTESITLLLMEREFRFSERRQDIIHHFCDGELRELTVTVLPLGQKVGHLSYKVFLLGVYELTFVLCLLGAQFLVDF